jgi:hypothetical protein
VEHWSRLIDRASYLVDEKPKHVSVSDAEPLEIAFDQTVAKSFEGQQTGDLVDARLQRVVRQPPAYGLDLPIARGCPRLGHFGMADAEIPQ